MSKRTLPFLATLLGLVILPLAGCTPPASEDVKFVGGTAPGCCNPGSTAPLGAVPGSTDQAPALPELPAMPGTTAS
ncbi:MAG: hypothetical protein ACYC6Y_22955 [Thermoguttaceae bacterium]